MFARELMDLLPYGFDSESQYRHPNGFVGRLNKQPKPQPTKVPISAARLVCGKFATKRGKA